MKIYFVPTLLFLPALIQGTSPLRDSVLPTNCDENGNPPICALDGRPMCGSDGVTYYGSCDFQRAECKDPQLKEIPCGSPEECVDKVLNCQDFLSFCENNDMNRFMKENCQKTCGLCEKGRNFPLAGGIGETKPADNEIQILLEGIIEEVERELGRTLDTFKVISYAEQVVAGRMIHAKVQIASQPDEYIHIRVIDQPWNNIFKLHDVKENKTLADEF